jgi:hypothetical protein
MTKRDNNGWVRLSNNAPILKYLDESCSLCGGPVAAFFYDSSVTLCCMHLQAIASSGRTHSALTGCLVLREYQQRTNYCQKEKAAGYKTAALKNKQMILLLTRRILISQYQFHLHMPNNERLTNGLMRPLPSLSDSPSRLLTLCSKLIRVSSGITPKDISFVMRCHEQSN